MIPLHSAGRGIEAGQQNENGAAPTSEVTQTAAGLPEELAGGVPRGVLTWSLAHLRPALFVGLVLLVLGTAWRELHAIDFGELRAALDAMSGSWVAVAAALAIVNIAGMGAYEVLALGAPWQKPPARVRWRIGSLSFAISNLMATGPLAGPTLRLWLYRDHGVSAKRIAGALVKALVGLWGGLAVLAVVLAALPGHDIRVALLLTPPLAFAVGRLLERVPLPPAIREGWEVGRPPWRWLLAVGVVDWMLATAVFLAVLESAGASPSGAGQLGNVALTFLAGHAVGALSLVPGGLGAADAFWLWRLGTVGGASKLAAAIVVYRFVYYVVPWLGASFVLLTSWTAERPAVLRFVRALLATVVAASGLIVLVSAATPAIAGRLELVGEWLPLAVLEASHAAAVLVGVGLVILSRGLRRGFREAMVATLCLLTAGALASLAKGGDWEEALVLGVTAATVLRHHRAFSRAGSLWPILDAGIAGRVLALAALFAAVALWAHRERPDAWAIVTEAAVEAEANRALRGAGLLALAAGVVGLAATLRPRRRTPSAVDVDEAIGRILSVPETSASALMVANGDKLVWTSSDRGVVLYSTIGGRMVVFGDPVAPRGAEAETLEAFLDYAEGEGWEVVLYQVSARWLPHVHDQGFIVFKLGEEAVIDLVSFTLEGRHSKALRHSRHQIERSGLSLRILAPEEARLRIGELRKVSDEWLATKHVPEKRFSVGFFDDAYLCRFPCAVAEATGGRIVAFASLLPGPRGGEASVDLMRYAADAPDGVMDALFVRVFEWAKAEGYTRFSLGMAPLATVGDSSRAPLWERGARFVYRHGEYFYNFRGLRQYKEKFHPSWEPRYMAYRRAWEWPRITGDVAALIAGGWARVVLPVGRGGKTAAS
ncbi:MAG: phosphatidylglycerol lysyltransferase [Candidatus Binatota bacterium]|nr:phosphatidylglycerol lysyltransferase [Candidatus Binatota bacterium]